jgi:hypothetical protein
MTISVVASSTMIEDTPHMATTLSGVAATTVGKIEPIS